MTADVGSSRIRVVVVDDTEDIRMLLRLQLKHDQRFEVVGEARDGVEAIEIAGTTKPNLMILDRNMPNLGGLEAIEGIRQASPETAVVLYTANPDSLTYETALDSGALHVLTKAGTDGFVDRLVRAIAEPAVAGATIELSVGPVSSEAARVWVQNSRQVLEAAVARPEISGARMEQDILDLLRSFLDEWEGIAANTREFRWVVRAEPAQIRRVVEEWAVVDGMSDEQLAQLGVQWAPPEGAPFFEALTDGILTTLRRHEETARLAAKLAEQFAPFLKQE